MASSTGKPVKNNDQSSSKYVWIRRSAPVKSPAMCITLHTTFYLYPVLNYKFIPKEPIFEKYQSVQHKFQQMRDEFEYVGMRRSVKGVLVVYEHKSCASVLLLESNTKVFKLPGGVLYPAEDEVKGLKRLLTETLGRQGGVQTEWTIEDLIGSWWRPNFESSIYPYIPPHIKKPKEHITIFLIQLPDKATIYVPNNYKMVKVPMLELLDNQQEYGHIISSLPDAIGRFIRKKKRLIHDQNIEEKIMRLKKTLNEEIAQKVLSIVSEKLTEGAVKKYCNKQYFSTV